MRCGCVSLTRCLPSWPYFLSLVISHSRLSLFTKDYKIHQAVYSTRSHYQDCSISSTWGLLPLVSPSSQLTIKSSWEPLVCGSKATHPRKFSVKSPFLLVIASQVRMTSCNTNRIKPHFLESNRQYQYNNSFFDGGGRG